ncbi:MAG: hypothetical protein R3B99_37385 [Polyangiales bacterium]|nr:hypothetical protein [Sandaracinus sp.]
MDGLRIPLLACLIAASMAGVLYAGVKAEQSSVVATPTELQPLPASETLELEASEEEPELPLGLEAPVEPELTVAIDLGADAELFPTREEIELADGVRIGLLFDPDEFFEEELLEEAPAPLRRVPRAPSRPPGPRLHSDPGMHSVLTARAMMASGEEIHGSCYAYLSEVYARAGHSSWRKRTIVYRQGRTGPYADLDLIRPGDWLYIVTGPNSTHSVMFVGWSDRARGYARTISHPGWFAGPHTGRESSYDVSQTYRIIRPTN